MAVTPVSRDKVSSAVSELGKWMHGRSASSKPQLLLDDHDDFFVLQMSLKHMPSNGRVNPFFLPLPHPIFPLSDPTLTPSLFLIIDDRNPDSPPASKFLEEGKECNLPISEVIGVSTLRTDYRPFESRRKLCGSYDLFLADKKILPLLPRLLGKTFFQKKKIPLPVEFSRIGWKEQIKRILNSTFFYLRTGTCSGIRVGRLSMDNDHIVDNVMAVIDAAVEKIPKKWSNVRSLHVKAVDSVALPIYQSLPEIGLKIEVPERENSGTEEVLNGGDEDVEVKKTDTNTDKNEKTKKKKKKNKGVRYTDEVSLIGEELIEEEEEQEESAKSKKRKKKSKDDNNDTNNDDNKKKKKKIIAESDNAVDLDTVKIIKKEKKKKKKKDEIGDIDESTVIPEKIVKTESKRKKANKSEVKKSKSKV